MEKCSNSKHVQWHSLLILYKEHPGSMAASSLEALQPLKWALSEGVGLWTGILLQEGDILKLVYCLTEHSLKGTLSWNLWN